MPYVLILLAASILLGAYYVAIVDASSRSKVAVGFAVGGILAVTWWRPQWFVVSTLLQLGVGVYVLLYLKAYRRAA